ncbi:MAG: hypothetical protein ABIO63_11210 [Casimicrobiaceae bacterium]
MPLVGFRPTKARLVIEDAKDSVLVMRCVVDPGDDVELASGGTLDALAGVLRIRERGANGSGRDKGLGTLSFVPESGAGNDASAAKFQLSVNLSADRFAAVMRAIHAGHLPAKFFVDVGGKRDAKEEHPALGFRSRAGVRIKHWDNLTHRVLPVASCVMIMALDGVQASEETLARVAGEPPGTATNAQVAELVDDLLVFQADTRHTMMGLVSVLAVVAAAALAIALVLLFRR